MIPGFRLPTHVTIEPGCVARTLGEVARAVRPDARRTLLVTDPGVRATAAFAAAETSLASAGLHVAVDDGVEPNPRTTTAERLGRRAREDAADVVVAVGGGSVLDAAKAAAMLATNDGPAAAFVGRNRFANDPLPFVAVPSTCGTGSEVTWVSVLSDRDAATKVSLKGDGMFPDAALVDADLLAGLPSSLVASTGIDALTHAVEALTVNCSNPVSDALATEAVRSLMQSLESAVAEPGPARAAVVRASTLAGMAFGNADVGAVHCLSESIGGIHDLPHGLLNAVLLAPVMRAHGSAVEAALARLERHLAPSDAPPPEGAGDAEAADRFLGRVERLVAAVGIPGFASLGIPAADDERLAEAATANGSNGSNPRPMAAADYLLILRGLR